MRTGHQITVQAADGALADHDALLFDPDPKSTSGQGARVIGFSPTAAAVLEVTFLRREDRPGSWWGANGWRANSTDRRIYAEGTQRHE
jgi:hypothetical protein